MRSRLSFILPLLLAAPAFAQVGIIPQQRAIVTNTPQVATLTTETTLTVHPTVSPDRRYVGMNINLFHSTLDGFDTIIYSGNPFGVIPGGGGPGPIALNAPVLRANQISILGTDNRPLIRHSPAIKEETSLQDAVKKLAAASKTNIHLSAGLTKAKIDLDARQKFDAPAGTVEKSLVYILAQGVRETPLAIRSEGNIITVMTRDQADTQIFTKTYALESVVSYLVHLDPKDAALKRLRPDDAPTPSKDTPATRALAKLVRPEVWKSNGGKTGEITQTADKITITAPATVHAELPIEELSTLPQPRDLRYHNIAK